MCNPNAGVQRGSRERYLAFGGQNLLKVWLGLPACWHAPELLPLYTYLNRSFSYPKPASNLLWSWARILELLILLPKCWDYRQVPLCLLCAEDRTRGFLHALNKDSISLAMSWPSLESQRSSSSIQNHPGFAGTW